jgi:hypothetical protein
MNFRKKLNLRARFAPMPKPGHNSLMTGPSASRKVRGPRWSVRSTLLAGFGLALLILIAIGIVSYRSTINVETATAARAHSDQVRIGIQGLLSQLQDY